MVSRDPPLPEFALIAGQEPDRLTTQVTAESIYARRHLVSCVQGRLACRLCLAVVLKPLHETLLKWTNRRIRGGLVDLKEKLPLLIGDLRETKSTTTVVNVILRAIEDGTHAQRSALVFGSEVLGTRNVEVDTVQEWFARWQPSQLSRKKNIILDSRDVMFPVRIFLKAEGVSGWLLVGSRPDNSAPSRDERQVLTKIAKPVVRSTVITRSREAQAAEHNCTIGLLDRAVVELRARLEHLDPG